VVRGAETRGGVCRFLPEGCRSNVIALAGHVVLALFLAACGPQGLRAGGMHTRTGPVIPPCVDCKYDRYASLALSPDNRYLYFHYRNKNHPHRRGIHRYDIETDSFTFFRAPCGIGWGGAAPSPDGKYLAVSQRYYPNENPNVEVPPGYEEGHISIFRLTDDGIDLGSEIIVSGPNRKRAGITTFLNEREILFVQSIAGFGTTISIATAELSEDMRPIMVREFFDSVGFWLMGGLGLDRYGNIIITGTDQRPPRGVSPDSFKPLIEISSPGQKYDQMLYAFDREERVLSPHPLNELATRIGDEIDDDPALEAFATIVMPYMSHDIYFAWLSKGAYEFPGGVRHDIYKYGDGSITRFLEVDSHIESIEVSRDGRLVAYVEMDTDVGVHSFPLYIRLLVDKEPVGLDERFQAWMSTNNYKDPCQGIGS